MLRYLREPLHGGVTSSRPPRIVILRYERSPAGRIFGGRLFYYQWARRNSVYRIFCWKSRKNIERRGVVTQFVKNNSWAKLGTPRLAYNRNAACRVVCVWLLYTERRRCSIMESFIFWKEIVPVCCSILLTSSRAELICPSNIRETGFRFFDGTMTTGNMGYVFLNSTSLSGW